MPGAKDRTTNRWNTDRYDEVHSFVYEYGEDVVDCLDPAPDERILDLGCGTGHLSAQIAERGAAVVGLDTSAEMLRTAREAHSNCDFVRADAQSFAFTRPFNAVFSNAALHWIPDQDAVLASVSDALAPNGRFVAELGGVGNVAAIVAAVREVAADHGYTVTNPWYFPSVGEYATRLESHGLETREATLFDRPTELNDGPEGLRKWLEMFGDSLLAPIPDDDRSAVTKAVEKRLRPDHYRDGSWIADYRRLRVVAVNAE
jgi:trans-aconitate methyltransferase